MDGEGDDVHAGDASVAAADECEDDISGAALHQPLAALWREFGGGVCTCTYGERETHTEGLVLVSKTNHRTNCTAEDA